VAGDLRSVSQLLGAVVAFGYALGCAAQAAPWIRAGIDADRPVWGLQDGVMVGVWPGAIEGVSEGGPRGLIRVGYPLGEPRAHRLVNFLAVEPDVGDGNWRGLSEIEHSALDNAPGKRFTAEPPPGSEAWDATKPLYPGFIDHPPDATEAERLRVCIRVERFDNGAHPYVVLTLRTDRPDEVMVEVFAEPDSAAMRQCVITATMGNYARLRRAYLAGGKVVAAPDLWPGFTGSDFAPFFTCPLEQLARTPEGDATVPMDCDEETPSDNWPHDPAIWWRWPWEKVAQYWRKPASDLGATLEFAANARAVYYGGWGLTIPGGVAFENTELREPYHAGQAVVLGITRRAPQEVAGAR
jgi:hypothetical protein